MAITTTMSISTIRSTIFAILMMTISWVGCARRMQFFYSPDREHMRRPNAAANYQTFCTLRGFLTPSTSGDPMSIMTGPGGERCCRIPWGSWYDGRGDTETRGRGDVLTLRGGHTETR